MVVKTVAHKPMFRYECSETNTRDEKVRIRRRQKLFYCEYMYCKMNSSTNVTNKKTDKEGTLKLYEVLFESIC